MLIFTYMAVLLVVGLALRIWQVSTGEYFAQSGAYIAEDAINMAFVYFGMIGIWGYAKKRAFFTQLLWKIYFTVAVALLPATPFISPKYQQLLAEHGPGTMLGAYAVSILLVLPALWAWFSYPFRQRSIWPTLSPAAA